MYHFCPSLHHFLYPWHFLSAVISSLRFMDQSYSHQNLPASLNSAEPSDQYLHNDELGVIDLNYGLLLFTTKQSYEIMGWITSKTAIDRSVLIIQILWCEKCVCNYHLYCCCHFHQREGVDKLVKMSATQAWSGTSFTDEFSVEIKIFDELCFHFILIQINYYKLMLMPWLLNFCAIMWKVCRNFFYYYYNEIWYFNQNWIKIENHMWHGTSRKAMKI